MQIAGVLNALSRELNWSQEMRRAVIRLTLPANDLVILQ